MQRKNVAMHGAEKQNTMKLFMNVNNLFATWRNALSPTHYLQPIPARALMLASSE